MCSWQLQQFCASLHPDTPLRAAAPLALLASPRAPPPLRLSTSRRVQTLHFNERRCLAPVNKSIFGFPRVALRAAAMNFSISAEPRATALRAPFVLLSINAKCCPSSFFSPTPLLVLWQIHPHLHLARARARSSSNSYIGLPCLLEREIQRACKRFVSRLMHHIDGPVSYIKLLHACVTVGGTNRAVS